MNRPRLWPRLRNTKTMMFIGIDPGKTGGLAVVDRNGRVREAVKMPSTNPEILRKIEEFAGLAAPETPVHCALEYVRSRPGLSSVAMFTFGRGYGALEMALAAVGLPFDSPTPQRWQTAMECMSKGDKNITKARAAKLWPRLTLTHATADACLIAEYCRRYHLGLLNRKGRR